jgi:hypothetical protein
MLVMSILTRAAALFVIVIALSGLPGCSRLMSWHGLPANSLGAPAPGGDRYPDILEVELRPLGDRMYDVVVTMSSPYDTPGRYADGWRVLDPNGDVLATHTLLHDHAGEQPFTRTQQGVPIPDGVDEITVQGRDQANGFGGLRISATVPE